MLARAPKLNPNQKKFRTDMRHTPLPRVPPGLSESGQWGPRGPTALPSQSLLCSEIGRLHEPLHRTRLFSELPRRVLLGNWVSGVGDSRKPNLCHHSFLETLYVGVISCSADKGNVRVHEQFSSVRS